MLLSGYPPFWLDSDLTRMPEDVGALRMISRAPLALPLRGVGRLVVVVSFMGEAGQKFTAVCIIVGTA